MPTDTSVKFLHSGMVGAPTLSGTAGALIALLDACLVSGFNTVAVDSIVIAGGIGTITRGGGLSFAVDDVVLVAGATVAGGTVNGGQKILSATPTSATFDATGLADQAATGAMTVKMAPLGWAKPFAGTNLAVYRPTDSTATGCYLRVDDTGTTFARSRGFETMSDVSTGVGPFPRDGLISGGAYWPKSDAANTSARPWVLVGDGRIFYLMVAYTSSAANNFGFNSAFGDINPVRTPDAYACVLHGMSSNAVSSAGDNGIADYDHCDGSAGFAGTVMPRAYTGLGGDIALRKTFPFLVGGTSFKSGAAGTPYPNYADGGLYMAPFGLTENATLVYRGASPGLFGVPQNVGTGVFIGRDRVTGVSGFGGKAFRLINTARGAFAFDVTGPWR